MRKKEELIDADTAGWKASGFGIRRLGPDCYLLTTYTLDQAGRPTRRATIWEKSAVGWRILYHQGTIITAQEDDVAGSSLGNDANRHAQAGDLNR